MFISCPAILSSFCKHLKPILTRLFTNVFGYLLFTTQSLIDIYLYRSIRKIGHFRGNKIRQPRSVSKLVSSCLVLLFGLISFCFIRLLIGFQNFGQHNWKTSEGSWHVTRWCAECRGWTGSTRWSPWYSPRRTGGRHWHPPQGLLQLENSHTARYVINVHLSKKSCK